MSALECGWSTLNAPLSSSDSPHKAPHPPTHHPVSVLSSIPPFSNIQSLCSAVRSIHAFSDYVLWGTLAISPMHQKQNYPTMNNVKIFPQMIQPSFVQIQRNIRKIINIVRPECQFLQLYLSLHVVLCQWKISWGE